MKVSEPLPSAFFVDATAVAVERTVIMYFIAPAAELPGKDEAAIFPMAGEVRSRPCGGLPL